MISFTFTHRTFVWGAVMVLGIGLVLAGCGGSSDPLTKISSTLKNVPTYSIVLDDMKEEGNFFKTYFHKYRVITPEKTTTTDWQEVPKDFFEEHLPFLGMTIFIKKDGKETAEAGPPGYEYVGDKRYGNWQRDSSGNSFWVFYGQYAMLSHLLGGGPIYRNNYNTYSTYRSQGRPYYGPNRQYGTNGSYTKSQKPNFYSRRMSSSSKSKTAFSDKVNSRVGRSSKSIRSRSGGTGK